MTPFSTLIAGLAADGAAWRTAIPEGWRQGRTAYGGLSAALCLAAAARAEPDLPPLRSAQFAFVGPAAGDVVLRPAVLRRGRSSVFVGVDCEAEAGLATRAVLCFGAARSSPIAWIDLAMPDVTPPAAAAALPEGAPAPRFLDNFDVRIAGGALPGAGADRPEILWWLRHRDPAAPGDIAALVALADGPPPAGLAALSSFVPISTATWMVDILGAPGAGWHLVRSAAQSFRDGYSTQTLTVWGEDGAAVLASQQMIAFYPPG